MAFVTIRRCAKHDGVCCSRKYSCCPKVEKGEESMAKWVYSFEEGSADMRNLLGGKGANLAEMTNLGLPIPQGFTEIGRAHV